MLKNGKNASIFHRPVVVVAAANNVTSVFSGLFSRSYKVFGEVFHALTYLFIGGLGAERRFKVFETR